jgi:predicted dehydrogenase
MPGDTVDVGLIGLGVIAQRYLRALEAVDGLRLVAACDPLASTMDDLPAGVARYTDHRALLQNPDVDAVIVAVPNDAHHPVCRDALLAGRAVCVEKPLAISLTDAEDLHRLARGQGLLLFTALHRRYNETVLGLLRSLPDRPPVREVIVRDLERIEEHAGADRWYLDPARCGGGCVADNGPNAYDLVRCLIGEVEVVSAELTRDVSGVDRQALVSLRAPGGATARVELDWSYPGERKDIEVRFADGSVATADMLAGFPGFKDSLWHEYEGIVRAFRDAGRDEPDPGLAALELVHATYRKENG